MYRFTNILFCPLGEADNPAAVRDLAKLVARNDARLSLLGVVPEPTRLQRALHRESAITAIEEANHRETEARLARCSPPEGDVPIESLIVAGNAALKIIERVLVAEHDLVVVTSDEDDEEHATIKRLLRKCPCPVWVVRPSRARTRRVLAAVDPEPAQEGLNKTILELAASMVRIEGGELHVVHAWEMFGEATLRSSAFMHTPVAEIEQLLQGEESIRRDALAELLVASGVDDEPWRIHLHKGRPCEVIRGVAAHQRINLLVMGTLARGGVAGLLMGNTADAVLDRVRCSVIALKPPGFETPVKLVAR